MHLSTNKLETPCFIFHQDILNSELEKIKIAFSKYWSNYTIGYSVKTNSFPPLAAFIQKKGISAEVVSFDEYNLAKHVGFNSKSIICNGPIKRENWIEEILATDTMINLDSHHEVNYICSYAVKYPDKIIKIGLRVNLNIEKAFPGETNAGEDGSRFGFSFEANELKSVIEKIKLHKNIRIEGLHLHNSTISRSISIYKWLSEQFVQITKIFQLTDIKYFDIGGGFFGGIKGKPTWDEYIKAIAEELISNGFSKENLALIIEPGVSLLASSFSYLCRVTDIKKTEKKQYIITDGSRIHIDPLFHKESYFYEILRTVGPTKEIQKEQQIVGFTCLENDRLFRLYDTSLLTIGDMIRFDKVGAYTLSLSPLFISYFPTVYSTTQNTTYECIREKWGVEQFIQLSKL